MFGRSLEMKPFVQQCGRLWRPQKNFKVLQSINGSWYRYNSTAVGQEECSFGILSLRIGKIEDISVHGNSDTMYVEQISLGSEEDPLVQVCSGLRNYIPMSDLQGSLVVLVDNMKPSKLRGVKSCGMLLCGSDVGNGIVQPCKPRVLALGALVDQSLVVGQPVKIEEDPSRVPGAITTNSKRRIKSKELDNILNRLYIGDGNQVVFKSLGKEYPLFITPKNDSGAKIPIVVDSLPRGTKVY